MTRVSGSSLATSDLESISQPSLQLLSVGSPCEIVDSESHTLAYGVIVSRRTGSSSSPTDTDSVQYYVHKDGQDKRLDGWVDQSHVRPRSSAGLRADAKGNGNGRDHSYARGTGPAHGDLDRSSTPVSSKALGKKKLDFDIEESDGDRTPSISRQGSPSVNERAGVHSSGRRSTRASGDDSDQPALRNIDRVLYGSFDIKTWYYSPYPLENDEDPTLTPQSSLKKRNLSPSPLHVAGSSHISKRLKKEYDASGKAGGALSQSVRDAPALKASAVPPIESARASPSPSASSALRKKEAAQSPSRMLWICEGCFKYMKTYNGYASHRRLCPNTHPPGKKVYQRGAHIIWQVDGAAQKLYCQNLSLFGKLFIDHKTIYFDVEPFLFYVLTDATASFDHPLGFFSKEKISYDNYNLACIITFPPFQRKSFGTLMIEFSYYLSSVQAMLGTPERPLSDLGLQSYLSYWTAVVVRALAFCFDGTSIAQPTSSTRGRRPSSATNTTAQVSGPPNESSSVVDATEAARILKMLRMRCTLLGLPSNAIEQPGLALLQEAAGSPKAKRNVRLKGWAGSIPARMSSRQSSTSNSITGRHRSDEGDVAEVSRIARGGELHPALDLSKLDQPFTLVTTLERISSLTHLRCDDIALALSEAGLLGSATTFLPSDDPVIVENPVDGSSEASEKITYRDYRAFANQNERSRHVLLLTRDSVHDVIKKFKIRPAVLDESYALV